jgi:hypothetical protein
VTQSIYQNLNFNITIIPNNYGEGQITITVSDGDKNSTQIYNVNVTHTVPITIENFGISWSPLVTSVSLNSVGVFEFTPTSQGSSAILEKVQGGSFKEIRGKIQPNIFVGTASFEMVVDNTFILQVFQKEIKLLQLGSNGIFATLNIFDEESGISFEGKTLYLNMWISNGKVYANVTDGYQNQIGRVVSIDTSLSYFGNVTFELKTGNQTSSSINLTDVVVSSEPTLVQMKRLEFLSNAISTENFSSATGQSRENIPMFKVTLEEDENQYINKTVTQIVQKDGKNYATVVSIDTNTI